MRSRIRNLLAAAVCVLAACTGDPEEGEVVPISDAVSTTIHQDRSSDTTHTIELTLPRGFTIGTIRDAAVIDQQGRRFRATTRDLDDGVVRGAKQVLGVPELAGAEEIPEGHAEPGGLPGQVLARHLDVLRVFVGPRGRSPGVAVAQIEIRRPFEPLADGMERKPASGPRGTHTRGVRGPWKSPPATMQNSSPRTWVWVTGRPAVLVSRSGRRAATGLLLVR